MPLFNQYEKVSSAYPTDLLLLDGSRGTRSIFVSDFVSDFVSGGAGSDDPGSNVLPSNQDAYFDWLDTILDGPIQRRQVYRGKNLGTSLTDEQAEAIRDGSFKGMFIGDYWEGDVTDWVIADFDYHPSSIIVGAGVDATIHHVCVVNNKTIGNPIYFQMAGETCTGYKTNCHLLTNNNTVVLSEAKKTFDEAHMLTVALYRQQNVGNSAETPLIQVPEKVHSLDSSMLCGKSLVSVYDLMTPLVLHGVEERPGLMLALFALTKKCNLLDSVSGTSVGTYWLAEQANTQIALIWRESDSTVSYVNIKSEYGTKYNRSIIAISG